MNTKGRKLFRGVLGALAAVVLMGVAYTTTVMASSIGMIDTADLLDIHAEADGGSEVVGQVMDEGHVAILAKGDGWVQIQAGDIVGWVPAENLIETEISNEEAVAANEEVIGELAEEAAQESEAADDSEALEEEAAQGSEAVDAGQTEAAQESEAVDAGQTGAVQGSEAVDAGQTGAVQGSEAVDAEPEDAENISDATAADAEAFAREVAVSAQKAELQKEQAEAVQRAQKEAEALAKAQQEAAVRAREQAEAQAKAAAEQARMQAEAVARAQAEAAAAAQLKAQQEAAQAEAAKAAEAARRQAILDANGITEEDLYLLANIIYCEAGCEPYIGKVAVGNVVMNRVKSDRQPDTIKGVIYAKGQFSPVRNGSLDRALRNGSADESCYQAALDALSGSKPVGDKLFFRRVNGRPGQVIGHHVFY